jgi:UDPglucose 6-dehydrogenase
MPKVQQELSNKINYAQSQYQALEGADALLIATEWSEFRTPDFDRIGQLLLSKVIFDGRNLFEVAKLQQLGYQYISIGRLQ